MLWAVLIVSMIGFAACGNRGSSVFSGAKGSTGVAKYPNLKTAGILRLLGPGIMGEVGENGVDDPVTGVKKPGYKELIALFNKTYPDIKVEVTATSWDNWIATLQTAVASNACDVAMHASPFPELVIDLSPYFDQEFLDEMPSPPEVWFNDGDDDNYDVRIPSGISYVLFPYYICIDKQLFADFGVPLPTFDWTWDELLVLAEKLTGTNPRTGQPSYGTYIFSIRDSNATKAFTSVAAGWGVKTHIFGAKSKYDIGIQVDTPEAIRVFDYLNKLSKFCPPGFLELSQAERIGMPENNIAIYLDENPSTVYNIVSANKLDDRFLYYPMPINETGEAKYSSFTGTNSLAIARTAAEPDLAWTFIRWMIMDEGAQDWLIRTSGLPNSKKGQAMLSKTCLPYQECVNAIFENFYADFNLSQSQAFLPGYGINLSTFSSNITEMYAGRITPEQCARNIQADIITYQNQNK
jgi:ABC-type glycerol-3-phosphate transport system substrate-binding protein